MHILTLCGSLRAASTNRALLVAFADAAPPGVTVTLSDAPAHLPAFSPDHEGAQTPDAVRAFAQAVRAADALVIASPEYVHALPGALKNALDWLVSGDELIAKPIALLHASHRGDDVLADLRRVLATLSADFAPAVFARFPLMKLSPQDIAARFAEEGSARSQLLAYWSDLLALIPAKA